jgi:RIO-like serine/threonine protein kinase
MATKVKQKGSTFTALNLKTVNGNLPVYKKNGVSTYYKQMANGQLAAMTLNMSVKNASGAVMKLAEHKKKTKTPMAAAPVPKPGPSFPSGWVNTGKLSNNGQKVYQSGLLFGIFKNGKIVQKFKGKAKIAPYHAPAPVETPGIAPVVTVSLVPVIKPGPDHIKAAETAYANSVKKVAAKLKELQEVTGANNAKNLDEYIAARGNMGFVHMNRTNTVTYKTTTVQGFHGGTGWRSSLAKPKFVFFTRQVKLSYTQYLAHKQLLFTYGKNVNSFENLRMSDIIDTKWLIAQDKYVRSLSSRQLFTMYGYSFKGDAWIHAYLGGYFDIKRFKTDLRDLSTKYFAFFFQARDFYKINSGSIDQDYNLTLARVRDETDIGNLNSIMNIFINELNEIIRKSPPVTRTFIVFRGQADDKYLSGITGNLYTTERFCSTSVNGDKARKTFSAGHTLQRITILKGSKCLLMFGATKFDDELEILLPRGSTYQIVKKRTNVKVNRSTNLLKPNVNPDRVQNLVDIVLIGSVEKAPPVEAVPVTVVPKTNVAIMQNLLSKQKGWSRTKITNMIGKGGYGAVYQAADPNFGNVAVKIQKKSNNSNAEVKALKKLGHTGVAPNYFNNKIIKANNKVAKIIPRGVTNGNNVSLLMSQMIRGSALKKWYTGAPVPQNIKNKIKNSIAVMHNKGVIHGNLHRNNIIIGNNGKAYIIDFGKSLVTNKSFKTVKEANQYLKQLTGRLKASHGKTSWYSNNKRTHFANGGFLARLM